AAGQLPQPNGDGEQPRSLPYSLETPYGFHLDLDFLKYVDDIEKGNTIRRVHIHRRAKQPKFSTLPRNFSLPENGSHGYMGTTGPGWPPASYRTQRKASLGAEEMPRAPQPGEEPSYRRKALLAETRRHAELARREDELWGRPQLLRASSLPAALPPGQGPGGDGCVPCPLRPGDNNSCPESTFRPVLRSPDGVASLPPPILSPGADSASQQQEWLGKGSPVRDIPKERAQPLWQGQHPAALHLQVVVESRGEEGDATDATSASDMVSALPSALRLTEESQNHAKAEGSVSEMAPNVLKEGEDGCAHSREKEEQFGDVGEPGGIAALKQQIAVLEEQLVKKKEELEQIRAVLEQQDQEIKEKEKSIQLLASSKAQLEEQLCRLNTREATGPCAQRAGTLQYCEVAVNTELSQVNGSKQGHDKGVNVNIPLSTKSIGCGVCRADNVNLPAVELSAQGWADVGTGGGREGPERFAELTETEAELEPGLHTPCFTELKIHEQLSDDNQNQRNNRDTQSLAAHAAAAESYQARTGSNTGKNKAGFGEDKTEDEMDEEGLPDPKDFPAVDPIGQYVKKIQELLQEQWMCLEHGYPELASAIKQPASKLSSIQNQLVNSLNSLLSAYSTQRPADTENSNTHYQQLETSPTTSLKSIMKKKGYGSHAGGNGTKKNLQFVGVNGGYETTSSEDTSCEESPSEGDAESETERGAGGLEPAQEQGGGSQGASLGASLQEAQEDDNLQEPVAEATPCTQQQADRCKPSEDFLADCQLLSQHFSEIRTTSDQHLRHVLSTVCQEWFRVSSRKSSSPEAVAAHLRALGAIQPQLLEVVVNMADRNGNTALHYSVSHSNFPIAKLLLDTGVCHLDLPNRAGYTAVMLTPLAAAETDEDMAVVMRLLKEGDVNVRAAQGGQTALMLGVSHEREDMVRALLACQADINLQDEQGSTALMVACRQGNADMVRLLLAQPGCQLALTNKDGDSALSLAQRSAHEDIITLLRCAQHGPS
ncbi:KANK4 protein, partial [Penelope pileata]|nr:KANK4 protein [Penelope pileata]